MHVRERPLNIVDTSNLKQIKFPKYHVLILPEGYTAKENDLKAITSFATSGGTVIAIGSSLKSFADKKDFLLKKKKTEEKKDSLGANNLIAYNKREIENIKKRISGSIFKSIVDNTHPMGFGYETSYYNLKLDSSSYKLLEKGVNVGYFPKKANSILGYAGEKALKNIPNSLLIGVETKGKGKLIYMVDNLLFRSFWENGKLFFANAVFLN